MFSIYKQFVSIKNNRPKYIINKIIARTIDLTLSSQKYNKYLDSFSDNSQEKIFERKTEYNLPFISPQKLIDISKNKLSKNRKTLTPKMKKKIITQFNIDKNNKIKNKHISNRTLQEKNIKFFLCDFDYITNKKEEKKSINTNKFCLTQENFLKFKNKLKNPFRFRKKQENQKNCENTKISNISKNQIFCLLDSVFTENKKDRNKNNDLIYNENEIFGFKNIYLDYLNEELKSLINKEKQIDMKSNINFNYNNKIYGKIIMEINSAKVEVFNKIDDTLISTVNIPFDILCIFYLSNVKQLAHIILNIFRNDFFLNNEKITNEEIKFIFEYIVTRQISYKNNILTFKNNFEDQDKDNILLDYLNYRNIKYRTNVRYNILSLNKKNELGKKIIFENHTYNNYRNNILNNNNDLNQNIYNKNVESMKNLFDSNINIINLLWISLDKNYIIKITMPYISIKLLNYKKQINYFINREIFVFLYKNNFKNWNFYISHYLFTLKKFRLCINNILSYYNLYKLLKIKNMNKNKKHLYFNNYKLNITDIENDKNNINISNINKNNILNNDIVYEKYNLSNYKFEQYENSLNDNEYIFFVSDDEYIHLYKMKSYVLFAYSCNELKNPKIYFFDFSFYQMKILFYKSKYENLSQFLQRLLKINKDKMKISLDYHYFNGFQTMNNKQIDYHFKESYLIENLNKNNLIINTFNKKNSNTIKINNNINKIIEKELIIKVSSPKFISVSIKKNKNKNLENNPYLDERWIKKEGEIGRNLMEKLVENDIKNWGTILWQNKDNIEALKYNKGLGSRRSNIFKGKKDFATVFKQFLKIK